MSIRLDDERPGSPPSKPYIASLNKMLVLEFEYVERFRALIFKTYWQSITF